MRKVKKFSTSKNKHLIFNNFLLLSQILINLALIYKINILLNGVNNYQLFVTNFLNKMNDKIDLLELVRKEFPDRTIMEIPAPVLPDPLSIPVPLEPVVDNPNFWPYYILIGFIVFGFLVWNSSSSTNSSPSNLPIPSSDNLPFESAELVNLSSADAANSNDLSLSIINNAGDISEAVTNYNNSVSTINNNTLWPFADFFGSFFSRKVVIQSTETIEYIDIIETVEIFRNVTESAL